MSNYRRAFIENSLIFVTMVTYKRNPILIKNIRKLIRSLRQVKSKYSLEVIGFVILPDHIHAIIRPDNIKEYPKIISLFKACFSRIIDDAEIDAVRKCLSQSKILKREKGVWQRRYWEHTIKDEQDLYKHLDYIHYNPVRHNYISAVKNWEYSSFRKFVKQQYYDINWGNLEDIKPIGGLIYE